MKGTDFKGKFLIIDDDDDDSDMFAEALHEVEPAIVCNRAGDGQELFEKLTSDCLEIPDIVFLDINLPVISGWQCLVNLKKDKIYSHIPVIIHSTSSRAADKQIAKDLGAICYLTKFDDFKKLKKVLQIIIDNLKNNSANLLCEEVYSFLGSA